MHYCIKVSVDDLLKGQSEDIILAFDRLLAEVADWDDVTVSCSKNYIVFVHHKTFFLIRPMKKLLDIKFYSDKLPEKSPITKSKLYGNRYENHIRITSSNDLTAQVFTLIKDSYLLL